jgi:hypothetical protein
MLGKKRRRAQGSRTRSAEQSEGILDPEHADDDAQQDQEGRSHATKSVHGVRMASQIWAKSPLSQCVLSQGGNVRKKRTLIVIVLGLLSVTTSFIFYYITRYKKDDGVQNGLMLNKYDFRIIISLSVDRSALQDGITCFVLFRDADCGLYVPMRYEIAPRRVFMDNVIARKSIADPLFFVGEPTDLIFAVRNKPTSVVISFRPAKSSDPSAWLLCSREVPQDGGEAIVSVVINQSTVQAAQPIAGQSEDVLDKLDSALVEYRKLADAEP